MTKARAKPKPRGALRAAAPAPSQRELFRRAARQLGVSASDYERADILAQVAELLMRHQAIGEMLAFKGGAIMTLIDGSPRLSADLDAVVVTGRAVRDSQVRAARASCCGDAGSVSRQALSCSAALPSSTNDRQRWDRRASA